MSTTAQVAVRPLAHIAEYSVNAHKSGVIKHVDYLKVSPSRTRVDTTRRFQYSMLLPCKSETMSRMLLCAMFPIKTSTGSGHSPSRTWLCA